LSETSRPRTLDDEAVEGVCTRPNSTIDLRFDYRLRGRFARIGAAMRLYFKLAIFIALFCAVQKYAPHNERLHEYWFGFRCDVATLTHDGALMEQLIEEARQVRDLDARMEASRANAAAP
jgi:hypothetical protein